MKVQRIQFWVDKQNSPYIKTKPFHHTQQIIEEQHDGTIFQIDVVHNFELERLLLGFGDSIEILAPRFLRHRIAKILNEATKRYV